MLIVYKKRQKDEEEKRRKSNSIKIDSPKIFVFEIFLLKIKEKGMIKKREKKENQFETFQS